MRFFTQLVFYSELGHFATVNSTVLLQGQSFCNFVSHFAESELNHLLQYTQPFFYSELSQFTIVLIHFAKLLGHSRE
jgi:hypothetical protein